MSRTSTRRQGFTLLEILVAIIVFVLAVASILPLFAVGSAAHRRGMDQAETAFIAARIAAHLQGTLYDTTIEKLNRYDQSFEEGGRVYTYDAIFRHFDSHDLLRAAYIVTVRVKWKIGGEEQVEQFETVLLRKTVR